MRVKVGEEMPKQRSEISIEAERRYHKGEKIADIAKTLNKSVKTIRRWKAVQKWDGKKAVTDDKKETEGQLFREQNFFSIEFEHITDENELALINEPIDKFNEAEKLIRIDRIRRYRMMKYMEKIISEGEPGKDDEINLKSERVFSSIMSGALQSIKQYHAMKMGEAKVGLVSDGLIDDWIDGVADESEE